MTRIQLFFWFSVPLAVLTFGWLSMETIASFTDEARSLYGLPLPWYAKSLVSSAGYDIALGPMLLDFLLYLAASHLLCLTFLRKTMLASKKSELVGAALWLGALLTAAMFLIELKMDVQVHIWTLDHYFGDNAQRHYFFQFGLGKK